MADPEWRRAWLIEASNHWMAYGSAITQIVWCFLLCFVYPIIAMTCCKGRSIEFQGESCDKGALGQVMTHKL